MCQTVRGLRKCLLNFHILSQSMRQSTVSEIAMLLRLWGKGGLSHLTLNLVSCKSTRSWQFPKQLLYQMQSLHILHFILLRRPVCMMSENKKNTSLVVCKLSIIYNVSWQSYKLYKVYSSLTISKEIVLLIFNGCFFIQWLFLRSCLSYITLVIGV